MVGTKSRGYSNSGRLSEGEYLMPFFSTRHSPNYYHSETWNLPKTKQKITKLWLRKCIALYLEV